MIARSIFSSTILALGLQYTSAVETHPADSGIRSSESVRLANADLEIKGLLTVAQNAVKKSAWSDAEAAYHKILSLPVAAASKRDALLEMGRMFETAGSFAKATMVYEGFLEHFHDDPAAADISIRLGRACRELGAFPTALRKFYNALNSTLRVNGAEAIAAQQKLALRAQFEIAETHFAKGDYAEAKRFFTRLLTLEMTPDDHELVEFRLAATVALLGDPGESVALARKFLTDHPASSRLSEARYLLAQSLQKLGRGDEAAREMLDLLKAEQPKGAETSPEWQRWKMKTGTELAGALYEKGEIMNALKVYQHLAELDTRPEWRWPIVYQIGLCFERLRLTQRALEAFAYLIDGEVPPTSDKGNAADLSSIREMAKWKMDYLRWAADADRSISSVVKPDWKDAAILPLKFRETPIVAPQGTQTAAN